MKFKEIITDSSEKTKKLAKDFARRLKPPLVVALYGELGAGKTTFVQGLAQGLGIKKRVLSPTFVFIRSYDVREKVIEKIRFHHVDLYRLDSEKDVESIGLAEVLEDRNAIVAIEWPEKIERFLPRNTIKIKLETVGENKRLLSTTNP